MQAGILDTDSKRLVLCCTHAGGLPALTGCRAVGQGPSPGTDREDKAERSLQGRPCPSAPARAPISSIIIDSDHPDRDDPGFKPCFQNTKVLWVPFRKADSLPCSPAMPPEANSARKVDSGP